MPFTDEELVAYADGELPAARAAEISAAVLADPLLRRRGAASKAPGRVLRGPFKPKLDEPVPQKLLDFLAEPASNKVVAFKPRTTRIQVWLPLAAAASVALAVGLSFSGVLRPHGEAVPVVIA